MPPKTMTSEMVEQERSRILNCSLELIHNKGFESVTMRTIGKKLNFSATKIYKYFHSKDEVLIAVAIESFKLITEILEDRLKEAKNPTEQLETFVNTYIYFSVNYRNHYEIIFGDKAPNYRQYFGTELEKIATEKQEKGLQFLNLANTIVKNFIEYNNFETTLELNTVTLNLICLLHGSVSFYNNRLLFEVCDNADEFRSQAIERIIKRFNEIVM